MRISSSAVDYLNKTFSWVADAVFPPRCVGCRRFPASETHRYLCKRCQRTIPIRHSSECLGCKTASSLGELCRACKPHYAIDRLLIAAPFAHPLVRKVIEIYKYRFVRELHKPLVRLLNTHIGYLQNRKKFNVFQDNPLLVPVPLHAYRYNWRGFNQAEILATVIARTFQMQSDDTILLRTRTALPQARTDAKKERVNNVAGIFACRAPERIRGRHILLIDDVCTSGATLNECARVLQGAGAVSVTGLVVARG